MNIVRALSMAVAALALLVATVPAADAAKPPAKHGKRTAAKKKQTVKKKQAVNKKKGAKKKAAKKKAPKKPVQRTFKVSADGSYYRTGTEDRDRYTQQIDWLAEGTVTIERSRGKYYMADAKLTGNIHGYAADYDLRWDRTSADGTAVGCRMKIEDRMDEAVSWTIDGGFQGSDPATAVPYLASRIGKIKRKTEGITTPDRRYDADCGYYDRGDYPYVVYQRQLAAFPDDAHGSCESTGSWKGGWTNDCNMKLKDGEETEFWNFTMSISR